MHTLSRSSSFLLLLSALILALYGCDNEAGEYSADITVTQYGIPHIKADNWGGLGYGFGYHFASDNLCVMARYLLKVRGEQSRHFGAAGAEAPNYGSDVLVRLMLTDDKLQKMWDLQDKRSRQLVQGYAAGYNRYLQQIPEGRHAECRGAQWLQPMEDMDGLRLIAYITTLAALGSPALTDALLSPRPPASTTNQFFHAIGEQTAQHMASPQSETQSETQSQNGFGIFEGMGSNAWGLGKAITESGKAILLGNPHYPWHGERRFYTVHMTIPGELDVMGAAIYGSPLVNIGFTENFAWTHTVSNAVRFTLYELQLDAADPMRYQHDGGWLPVLEQQVTVPVKQADDTLANRTHRLYHTDFGFVINMKNLLQGAEWTDWPNSEGRIYVLRDAATAHPNPMRQSLGMVTAASLDEFIANTKRAVGHTFINTIAVGRNGEAWYGDISTIPNLPDSHWDRCAAKGRIGQTLSSVLSVVRVGNQPLPVLDGSRSECQWLVDDEAPGPGLMPARMLADLKTDRYVANSNDSYWLSSLEEPIEGKHRVQGGERYPVSLRTQMGLSMIQDRLRGIDGLDDGTRFTTDHVKHLALLPRNGAGERVLGDLKAHCSRNINRYPDIRPGCRALAKWDATNSIDAQGSVFFMQLWQDIQQIKALYRQPFDAGDPLATPAELNLSDPQVGDAITAAMQKHGERFAKNNLDPAAPQSQLQYVVRNGKRIPIAGGYRGTGSFNMIIARLNGEEGWSEIEHGNSYIQVVTWDEEDRVTTDGILTYSQSTDPTSPHYSDQTEFYAEGGWIRYPFRAEDVAAEAVSTYRISTRSP